MPFFRAPVRRGSSDRIVLPALFAGAKSLAFNEPAPFRGPFCSRVPLHFKDLGRIPGLPFPATHNHPQWHRILLNQAAVTLMSDSASGQGPRSRRVGRYGLQLDRTFRILPPCRSRSAKRRSQQFGGRINFEELPSPLLPGVRKRPAARSEAHVKPPTLLGNLVGPPATRTRGPGTCKSAPIAALIRGCLVFRSS